MQRGMPRSLGKVSSTEFGDQLVPESRDKEGI